MRLFKSKPGQLESPPITHGDRNALEIARIWIAEERQHVVLRTEVWEDPAAWGLMLVDLARHVAVAYEQSQGLDRAEALARIRQGFDAEWNCPTDKPTGGIL